ncbi:MAG: hypothetical protein H6711_07935 [Myxococcales bacterium]|nr:hypothetical protein [Myxococcales bacterium]
MPTATTIDDVISQLDAVIADARRDGSRSGYFAALYRKVTIQVKRAIAAGDFDDGARMEELDVRFANRYLEAVDAQRRGEAPLQAWDLAFQASRAWTPLVLQHLLLGMNAHINLDLGVAAALTSPGAELDGLRDDFNRINGLLASLVDEVKSELAQIWSPLAFLDRISGTIEDVGVNFSMAKARDAAWELATSIAHLDEGAQATAIAERDAWAAGFGKRLWRPPIGRLALLLIRLGERRDVRENIEILL